MPGCPLTDPFPGPAARGWGHPARMITSPSGHKSILSYPDSWRSQPGVACRPCLPALLEARYREGTA